MSATILDCLRYALGISRMDCPCYSNGIPSDASVSDSGLYLLETEGLEIKSLASLTDCSDGGIWAMAEWARNEAIQSVVDDLVAAMQMITDPVAIPFYGLIAELKFNQAIVSGYGFHSLRILPRPLKGGIMKVKRIALMFQETATFDLILYDNQTNTLIDQWTVTSEAGKVKWFTLPDAVDLEMLIPGANGGANTGSCNYLRYEFIYVNDGSLHAMNNQVNCGCGGSSYYSETEPIFSKTKDTWSEWVIASGAKGNDFLERENGWLNSAEANGLALDLEIYCDTSKTICNETMNFKADPLARVLAWAIRFRAAMFLTSKLLNAKEPNRFTTAGREQMAANYTFYNEQSNARIATLADEWSRPGMLNRYSDCFICKPFMRKRGILA